MIMNSMFFEGDESSSDTQSVIKSKSCDKELADLARAQKPTPRVSRTKGLEKGKSLITYLK